MDLEDLNTLRNLSEIAATKTLIETFRKQIKALTIQSKGDAELSDWIKLRKTRPFAVKEQGYHIPKKSIFNGDSHLELQSASFLEQCEDVISYVKNYFVVQFRNDYVRANADISNHHLDFIVKTDED